MNRTNTTSGKGEGHEALAPEPVPPNAVLLQAHLWTEDGGEVPPPAFAMVADLLQVRGGELKQSPVGLIAASFADPAVALNAGRNVQRLVQGFSSAWQGGVLGGCSLLTRADEGGGVVDSGSLRGNSALKQTHPGQVIVAGGLCDVARSIPGLEFRAMTGMAPAGKQGTAQQALQLLPPTRMEGFIEEPFEPRPVVREVPVATEVAALAPAPPVEPLRPAYDLVSSPASGLRPAVPLGATVVSPEAAARGEIGAFSREEKTSGGAKLWAILGGVAAVVVAGVLLFTPVFRRSPRPASAQPAAQPSPVPVSAPAESVPAREETHTPAPVKAKANDPHGKNATHIAEAPAVPEPAPVPAPAPAPPPAPLEDIRPAHGLTFTPAEINLLIAHADKDSGNGNFDKAIREYRVVLNREPGNDIAKRGLARALYNKEHQ